MARIHVVTCAAVFGCAMWSSSAQAQSPFDGFHPPSTGRVLSVVAQDDGKIVVAGDQLKRINADGSIDASFTSSVVGEVRVVVRQNDGRLLVGGSFTMIAGVVGDNLARLNADGTLDPTFGAAANDAVNAIAVQSDGRIVVGGEFTALRVGQEAVVARHFIGRLQGDGSIDQGFDPGSASPVLTIALQRNLAIAVGTEAGLARLAADGTVDASFNPSINGAVRAIGVASDAGLVIGGDFAGYLARLRSDGSPDTTFSTVTGGVVRAIAVQPDGRVIIGGDAPRYVGRLQRDGAVDETFNNPLVAGPVLAVALQPDGRILAAGAAFVVRLHGNGSSDTDLTAAANNIVWAIAVQPDGKILVGGQFTMLAGVRRNYLGRLNPDGSLDTAFNPGANDAVYAFALQPDGKIVVGGSFTTLGGGGTGTGVRQRIGRLNGDGSIDAGFDAGANNPVTVLALQDDGRVVVGGLFTTFGGGGTGIYPRARIARLDTDGAIDLSFDPGADNPVYTIIAMPDGKVVVGGSFTMLGGGGAGQFDRAFVGRLHPDGSMDESFDPGADGTVYALASQLDGRLIVGGGFTMLGGGGTGTSARAFIGRLEPDGTIDLIFDPGADGEIRSMTVQSNGRVVVAGAFTTIGGGGFGTTPRLRVARLTANGDLDDGFSAAANNAVLALAVQADGRIVMGGMFTALSGQGAAWNPRPKLGRLSNPDGSRDGAPRLSRVSSAYSSDGSAWSTWRTGDPLPFNTRLLVRTRAMAATGHGNGSISRFESMREVFVAKPSIASSSMAAAIAGVPYTSSFATAGAVGVVTFATTSRLPSGISLSSAGVVAGTPAETGSFPLTITATDLSSGGSSSIDVTLNVGCPAISLSASFPTGRLGAVYPVSAVLQSGGVGPVWFSLSAGTLPAGLTFAGDGRLGGTPSQTGSFTVTIRAVDVNGCTGAQTYALAIVAAPAITTHPASQTVPDGAAAVFIAAASGYPAVAYQWQVSSNGSTWSAIQNGIGYSGATASALTVANVSSVSHGLQYRAVAANTEGSVVSGPAVLTVTTVPAFTTVPISQTVTAGAGAIFTVAAIGNPAPAFQWQVAPPGGGWQDLTNTAPYSVSGSSALAISTVVGTMNGARYRAVATNAVGSAVSADATLTVQTAPVITLSPAGQTVTAGAGAIFTVAATGKPAPAYQWQVSSNGGVLWTNLSATPTYSGATTSTLTILTASALDGFQYRAVATNSVGTDTSSAGTLVVNSGPTITLVPTSQTVVAGVSAAFTVAGSGKPAPAYQWQVSSNGGVLWTNLSATPTYSGATTSTLTILTASALDGFQYRAVATNSVGTDTSSAALLIVHSSPAMTVDPTSQTVVAGSSVTFTAAASGKPTPSYQWQVSTNAGASWTNIAGGTSPALTIASHAGLDGFYYRAVATNVVGSAASGPAALTVNSPPAITLSPASQVSVSGSVVVFSGGASGKPAPVYQWDWSADGGGSWISLVDGGPYAGARTDALRVTAEPGLNAGRYRLMATSALGSAVSGAAILDVIWAPSITRAPSDQTVDNGGGAAFSVAGAGNPPPQYQWQTSSDGSSWSDLSPGSIYSGATATVLVLGSATLSLNGYRYRAIARNSVGSAASGAAMLTVRPVSAPAMALEAPGNGSTVASSFVVSGWAVDTGGFGGPGVDAIEVSIVALSGGSTGQTVRTAAATFGQARPDVGASYGASFANAGFSLAISGLAPGSYRVVASARSVITGTFNNARSADVTVPAPVPDPTMALDSPANTATVNPSFTIAGWAIDRGAESGAGVDAVHIWAFPPVGDAVFLGSAQLGLPREDVGAYYGPRFTDSGFALRASNVAPGAYRVGAYAHSTVSNTFNQVRWADITVGQPVSDPAMALDAPGNGASLSPSFVVAGWAVDLGSYSDSGVDAIHVWAFPWQDGTFGAGVFVGQASYGIPRPDVGAVFGERFTNSGFWLQSASLPLGSYRVIAYAHSSIANAYNSSRFVDIVVSSGAVRVHQEWLEIKSPATGHAPVRAVAVSSSDPGVIWVGYENGEVFRTSDGTSEAPTWDAATGGWPRAPVTALAASPADPSIAYVSLQMPGGAHIWRTQDGGQTWRALNAADEAMAGHVVTQIVCSPDGVRLMTAAGIVFTLGKPDGI